MDFFIRLIATLALAGLGCGLEDFRRFAGPSCSSIRETMTPADADRAAIDRIRYVVAAHRYALYRVASFLPNYATMTEDELLNTICFSRNSSTTAITRPSGLFAFGQFLPLMVSTRPGVYLSSPFDPNGLTVSDIVTLTDEKTFAVMVNCWNGPGVDASSYLVVSQTSQLPDGPTWRRIQEHLSRMGFKSQDMLIPRNGNCTWRENPALEEWTKGRPGPSRYPSSAIPPKLPQANINYNQPRFGKPSWQGK